MPTKLADGLGLRDVLLTKEKVRKKDRSKELELFCFFSFFILHFLLFCQMSPKLGSSALGLLPM
ncbi:hypothetical protein BZZ01_18085 [Nostocales cyanobacterium HT-58-2]|nr:hypothetical protein BZZ01_18085 [Nostocales cyanobacterium HT-58-2]